jgi:small-conductance mechanosensitive channel
MIVLAHKQEQEVTLTVGILLGSLAAYHLLFLLLKKFAKKKERFLPGVLNEQLYWPGALLMLTVALQISFPFLAHVFPGRSGTVAQHALRIATIAAVAWLIIAGITVLREFTLHKYKEDNPRDFTVRKAKTRFQLIQRMVNGLIIAMAIAAALMTFRGIREIGSTLLASAGVVGLVLGFAAQKSLGTLFSGIQIAISQPIRLSDTVVVDGQFGTIGEISLTYVVVNTWDGRRLIVPINYFLEKPFENWTRVSPEVVGKVRIHTDYSLPVDEMRTAVRSWVEENPLWDKRKFSFLVVGANEKTIEVRATMSAANADDAFDLECIIREKMITWIRENYPQALPKERVEVERSAATGEN